MHEKRKGWFEFRKLWGVLVEIKLKIQNFRKHGLDETRKNMPGIPT